MTTTAEPSADTCHTCGNSSTWHAEFKPMHPFNDGHSGAKALLGAGRDRDRQSRRITSQQTNEAPSRVVWPTDPVLRVALINKGILTADDLRQAEEMLKVSMGLEVGKRSDP